MKTKRITALLMALTLTAALFACGSKTKSNTPASEKAKAASIDEKPDDATASAITAMDEATEEAIDVAAQPEGEPGATVAADEAKSDKADSATPTTTKAKTKSSESNTAKAKSSNAPASHQHNWKDHTATEQVWVSNMVTVDDYEWQKVDNTYAKCACGATFYPKDYGDDWGAVGEAVENHAYERVLEKTRETYPWVTSLSEATQLGIANTDVPCTNWWIAGSVEDVKVKVGSHQEDQGHYETRTYIDYRYCDCGARQ